MSHILVTGANGFIGSHLVRKLLKMKEEGKLKEEILCMVRSTSQLSSLKNLDVKLIIGDLRQPETLVKAVKGATIIYHLGAELFTISRKRFLAAITYGTKNLLEAAVNHASDTLKRFVYISTLAAAGPTDSNVPITEEREPPEPVSWYAESKLEAEKIVKEYASKFKLRFTIIRPTFVYGERDPQLLPVFKIVEKRLQPRSGFKKRYVGMIYGKDLVEGIIKSSMDPKAENQTYFMTNPENYPVRETINIMARALGKPFGLKFPVPIFVSAIIAYINELFYLFFRKEPIPSRDKIRDMSWRYWVCSSKKAKEDLGWEAKTSLLDGMKATYKYIKEEELNIKKMPDETKGILWLKYFSLGIVMGIIIEVVAALGRLYIYKPGWLVIIVILGLWGVIFGSLAQATRVRGFLLQYIPGFILLFGLELLNHYILKSWEFSQGTFLYGLTPLQLAAAIGFAIGFLVPIINAVMRTFYKFKLRVG